MTCRSRVAVVGAGIYGSTAALHLAERRHHVDLFDPRGVMRATSATNQYRVHAGYHYPRSPETIEEVLAARAEFSETFDEAVVRSTLNYYAIPHEGSQTTPDDFERTMDTFGLPLMSRRPSWIDFDYIDRCYEVAEEVYDPDVLRRTVEERLASAAVRLRHERYEPRMRDRFDVVVHATYGLGASRDIFRIAKVQVAEKVLIELPPHLRGIALVVADGPFTGFDPYGASPRSLFGSARHTNHWTATEHGAEIPEAFRSLLQAEDFSPVPITRFAQMRASAALAVPESANAGYVGSRFAVRVVEDSPADDRRVLHVREGGPGELHIFSGKVVSAVTAARTVAELVDART
ncbi:FAD-dependent oxidoreductase [Isoptericola jiangsuensis]|uniref:FAD-dependent oxidoreductase n=1 Tax=Isoptericola jiangsuensis TaxID=548579 RepID=UPI003AAA8241